MLLATVIVAATTVFASPIAHGSTASPGAESMHPTETEARTPAGRTVTALVSARPRHAIDTLPTDFADRFGYRPPIVDGYPTNPHGSCSTPIRLPRRFENLCATHDFGYDLLRYAARHGHPLGGWARRDLDRQLVTRMHGACSSPGCSAAAVAADIALRLNTWRQHDGPPTGAESTGDLLATTLTRTVEAVTGDRVGQRR